jgi:hypothetical protein
MAGTLPQGRETVRRVDEPEVAGFFRSLECIIAGSCDGKVNIWKNGWNHEEREGHEGGRAVARKIRFGGTVQKSAVPCGFGECIVHFAERKTGHMVSEAGANVDCTGSRDFLKSFREKPGKSGIAGTCKRLKRVTKGWDVGSNLRAAFFVFIIQWRLGKRGHTTGVVIFRG